MWVHFSDCIHYWFLGHIVYQSHSICFYFFANQHILFSADINVAVTCASLSQFVECGFMFMTSCTTTVNISSCNSTYLTLHGKLDLAKFSVRDSLSTAFLTTSLASSEDVSFTGEICWYHFSPVFFVVGLVSSKCQSICANQLTSQNRSDFLRHLVTSTTSLL